MVLALSFHTISVYKRFHRNTLLSDGGGNLFLGLSLCFPCSPSSFEPTPDRCGCINTPAPLPRVILGHELCIVSNFHLEVSTSCRLQFPLNNRLYGDGLPLLSLFSFPWPISLAPSHQLRFLAQCLLLGEPELRQRSSLATS